MINIKDLSMNTVGKAVMWKNHHEDKILYGHIVSVNFDFSEADYKYKVIDNCDNVFYFWGTENLEIVSSGKEGGMKFDDEKMRWDLLPLDTIGEAVKVLTAGAKKYTDDNWKKVESKRYHAALLRHLEQWQSGEEYDIDLDELGCRVSHLACALTNVIFLLWKEMHGED